MFEGSGDFFWDFGAIFGGDIVIGVVDIIFTDGDSEFGECDVCVVSFGVHGGFEEELHEVFAFVEQGFFGVHERLRFIFITIVLDDEGFESFFFSEG